MDLAQILWPLLTQLNFATDTVVTVLGGSTLFLLFTAGRSLVRRHRSQAQDALALKLHKEWREIVRGDVPAGEWIGEAMKREIILSIVGQEISAGVDKDRAGLQEFLRASGLITICIRKVHDGHGLARRRAMLSLGEMRVLEAVEPLSEALDDWQLQTRLSAVESLGRTGLVEAAEPIIEMLMVDALKLPSEPVCNALIRCFMDSPTALLPYLQRSRGKSRELLARVAGEIAMSAMADEMIVLSTDPNPEVRASAAKGLAFAPLAMAIPALGDLARDEEWFVRLRATIAIARIPHPRTIPILLEAVRDSNRKVRIRAAEALTKFEHETVDILQSVVESRDRYALHAMISALDLGGGFEKVMAELSDPMLHDEAASRLLSALREGAAGLWGARPADPAVESVFP